MPISLAREIIAFLVIPSKDASKFGVNSSLFFIANRFSPDPSDMKFSVSNNRASSKPSLRASFNAIIDFT